MNQLVGILLSELSDSVLLGGFAISTAGYAIACIVAYHQTRELGAILCTLCIVLVLTENTWNWLMVTPAERLMVVMPVALDTSFAIALAYQAQYRGQKSCNVADSGV